MRACPLARGGRRADTGGGASWGVGRVESAVEFRSERGGGLGIERRHRSDVRLVRLERGLQLVQRTGGLAATDELGPGGQPFLAGLEGRRAPLGGQLISSGDVGSGVASIVGGLRSRPVAP
jgi:hypothetical protein